MGRHVDLKVYGMTQMSCNVSDLCSNTTNATTVRYIFDNVSGLWLKEVHAGCEEYHRDTVGGTNLPSSFE